MAATGRWRDRPSEQAQGGDGRKHGHPGCGEHAVQREAPQHHRKPARHGQVLTARNEVVREIAQMADRAHIAAVTRRCIGETRFHRHGGGYGRTEIATARNGGEQIDTLESNGLFQRLHRAEAERG